MESTVIYETYIHKSIKYQINIFLCIPGHDKKKKK
jgi:hypothetical protein